MTDIFILRHGDAEPRGRVPEADRQLTPKGKRDVERVVKLALGKKLSPELILTSPYRRAVETAEIVRGLLPGKIRLIETPSLLPEARPEETWKELRSFAKTKQILIAGHEPHLSHLVAYLLGTPSLDLDLKKGALVRISLQSVTPEPRGQLKWIVTPALTGGSKTPRS